MTRGRFYGTAMPIWGVLYAMGLLLFHNSTFTVVGAMVFALIAIVGATVIRPPEGTERQRNRNRNRK